MDIKWEDIRLFLAVAEEGSLSAAARKLRLGQPTLSRRMAELEAELGQLLFFRDVRGITLTAEGARLLDPARRMAEWAAELERAAERETTPGGSVRITAPPGIAFDFVAPFATQLRKELPEVTLEVISGVSYLDLGRREADLALRTKAADAGELVTVATKRLRNAVLASKSYARTLPKNYGIADLDWIAWAPPREELAPNPQLAKLIPNFRPCFASDDFVVQLSAAEAGVGAMIFTNWQHNFKQPSRLVELSVPLGPYSESDLHLIATRSSLQISRVREVAERMARELRA